jgi:uncharacterized protein YfdQ (DUF2303 family)
MSIDSSAVQAIADLAIPAVEDLELGKFYVLTVGSQVHRLDLTGDEYRDAPRRKAGTTTVRDVASFLAYFGKHSDGDSEIYASRDTRTVTAVLDAHQPAAARFGQHRVVLQLKHTEAYEAWAAGNGKLMPQNTFAEFIEDRRAEITSPPAADLLELAQHFEATTKVTFRSGTRLKSGQRMLTYVEEQNASGGSGELAIPDSFDLAVPVFEGAQVADALTARLRYRISDGKLYMAYILDELTRVLDGAFWGVIAEIDREVPVPILRGTPA